MNMADALFNETNRGAERTANGALSYGETASGVLDFFSKSGALRGNETEAIRYFGKAVSENTVLALRALFYMRDVRSGQGERENFRDILKYYANRFPLEISRNMKYIPEFGRWDDLYTFVGTKLQDLALDLMKDQFKKDMKSLISNDGSSISLLAKWLKSENTSSVESRKLGAITRSYFELSPKKYRKALSILRAKIDIVETTMSKKKWSKIVYSKVPSQASRIYSNSFRKHDEDRYNLFIEKVHTGEEKINAGTLYPYDIVKNVRENAISKEQARAYDAMWKALPNYVNEPENSIAIVDVSGSMNTGSSKVAPIDVAVSLGIYFAEHNVGPFKDYFITFSSNPTMQKIQGVDIAQKCENLMSAQWDMNTNLQKAFDLILNTALKTEATQEELPKKVYIISDMQFDAACGNDYFSYRPSRSGKEYTNFEAIDDKFKSAGYERPQIVFWNVNASSDTPVTKDENGTFLVSGCSPSILKYAVNCIAVTPYDLMLEVLNSDRYSVIN